MIYFTLYISLYLLLKFILNYHETVRFCDYFNIKNL